MQLKILLPRRIQVEPVLTRKLTKDHSQVLELNAWVSLRSRMMNFIILEQIHGLKHVIQIKTQLPKRILVEQELMKSKIPIRVKVRRLVLTAWDLHKLKLILNSIILEQTHG